MSSFKNISLILIIIAAVTTLVFYVIKVEQYKNELIKVVINLKNNCELIDDAFMVISTPGKKIGKFINGKVEMLLPRSSKVQLAANNKYAGFHFSSIPTEVSNSMILEANCTNSDRLDNIFDSLREQFNK